MALIKLTAIVDQISGKLNGTVFSHNRGGAYMRSKGSVTNPQSLAQMAVRATFGAIASSWSNLTEFARESWRQTAALTPYINRLGDSKTLSGFAYHQQVNTNLALIGEDPIVFPPEQLSPVVAIDTVLGIAQSEEQDTIALTITPTIVGESDPSATTFLVYATPSLPAGASNFDNSLRLIDSATAVELTEGIIITKNYSDIFGQPPIGGTIGIRLNPIQNESGRAGAPAYAKSVVTLKS